MRWRVAHASALGTSHSRDNTECQDFNLVDEVDGYLVAAVADGAGSARLSAIGARLACTESVLHLKKVCATQPTVEVARVAMHEAFEAARRGVLQEAQREEVEVRELSSTLSVALVSADYAVFGQVGDGATVFDLGSGLTLAHWPDQEALNLTDFLTSAPLSETLSVTPASGRVHRFVMMTDGLSQLLLDFRARAPHPPALEPLLSACRSSPDPAALNEDLRKFLGSPAVNDRSDDDKTLVIAVLHEEAP